MKRFIGLMTAGVVLSLSLSVTSASGQTETTTTLDPGTTTTLDPGTTTTLDPGTTTTLDPGATTLPPAPTTTIPIVLQGEHVTSGTLSVGATFETQVDGTCALAGDLLGQEMNIIFDETGKIGAVYGKATLGGGDVGLVMVELGPLPMAIAAFRTTGGCNQDVVAIGPYTATATTAGLNSIGYAIFPNDYVPNVKIDLTVNSSVAPGSLDLQAAYDYLAAPRTPPTTVPPTTTTTTIP